MLLQGSVRPGFNRKTFYMFAICGAGTPQIANIYSARVLARPVRHCHPTGRSAVRDTTRRGPRTCAHPQMIATARTPDGVSNGENVGAHA
jgi:hypothetical protein